MRPPFGVATGPGLRLPAAADAEPAGVTAGPAAEPAGRPPACWPTRGATRPPAATATCRGTDGATADVRDRAAIPVAVARRPWRTTRDSDDDKCTVELLLLPGNR